MGSMQKEKPIGIHKVKDSLEGSLPQAYEVKKPESIENSGRVSVIGVF